AASRFAACGADIGTATTLITLTNASVPVNGIIPGATILTTGGILNLVGHTGTAGTSPFVYSAYTTGDINVAAPISNFLFDGTSGGHTTTMTLTTAVTFHAILIR